MLAALPAVAPANETSEVLRTRALFSIDQQLYGTALGLLRQAVTADPGDLRARYYRGVVHSRLGNQEAAIADLRAVSEAGPEGLPRLPFQLGYALYRAGDHAAAEEQFVRAVERTPDDAEANLYLGLARRQQGNADGALAPLERAADGSGEVAEVAAFTYAQTLRDLGREDAARGVLSGFAERFPDSVYAGRAQEELAAMQPDAAAGWRLTAGVGAGYDSNVGLFPDGEPLPADVDSDGDYRLEFGLGAAYHGRLGADTRWSAGYDFFQSLHPDLDRYDVRQHALSAGVQTRSGDIWWGGSLAYARASLDGEDYLDSALAVPFVALPHGERRFSLVRLSLRRNDYRSDGEQGRDGNDAGLAYRHYWLEPDRPQRRLFAGAAAGREDTDADEFSYDHLALEGGLEHPLAFGLLKADARWQQRDYDGPRDDDRFEVGAALVRPVGEDLEAELSGRYIANQSSVDAFDYTRSLLFVNLRWEQ